MSEHGASGGQAAGEAFDATTSAMMPDAQVLLVQLLRHGEVSGFEQRRVRGQEDVALSERGLEQSRRLARFVAAEPRRVDALYTSDLARCRALADLCGRELGVAPVAEPRLREQSMGAWQGRTWEELSRGDDARVRSYWSDPVASAPPGGESLHDLHARVGAWLDELLARHAGGRVVVVTHVGPIRAILCRALGLGPDEALRFAPAVASHTELLVAPAGWVVNAIGERPWRVAQEPPR